MLERWLRVKRVAASEDLSSIPSLTSTSSKSFQGIQFLSHGLYGHLHSCTDTHIHIDRHPHHRDTYISTYTHSHTDRQTFAFLSLTDHNLRSINFPLHVILFSFPVGSIIHLFIHSTHCVNQQLCQALCSPGASAHRRPDAQQASAAEDCGPSGEWTHKGPNRAELDSQGRESRVREGSPART